MNKEQLIKKIIQVSSETRKYNRNSIIFNEGDLCNKVGIIINGEVTITSYSFNGQEIIFNKIKKNNIFGKSLIFSSSPYYKGAIISQTNSTIKFVNKNELLLLLNDIDFLTCYLSIINDEVINAKEKARILAFKNIEDRLLYYLTFHEKICFESITILARDFNVSREALSRKLKNLIKTNIIKIEGKCISLVK